MLYYDFSNQSHIIVVDPAEGEIVADHEIDGSFIELQINNREFMVATYGNTNDIIEASPAVTVTTWPNPATTEVNIQHAGVPYCIYDEAGRLMRNWSQAARINTTQWPVGTYVISCADGANARFVVVR